MTEPERKLIADLLSLVLSESALAVDILLERVAGDLKEIQTHTTVTMTTLCGQAKQLVAAGIAARPGEFQIRKDMCRRTLAGHFQTISDNAHGGGK